MTVVVAMVAVFLATNAFLLFRVWLLSPEANQSRLDRQLLETASWAQCRGR
jgi:hypothetical protein